MRWAAGQDHPIRSASIAANSPTTHKITEGKRMTRFVVLYCAPHDVAERFAQATPEEAQAGLASWVEWAERLGPALVDPGRPLGNALRVTPSGVTKGDTTVIGMSIVQANSRDEALGMVSGHHHLRWSYDCEILLLEEMGVPELQR
jgi:hypothetical protein